MSVEKLDFTDLANLSIIINNFRTLMNPALEEYKLIIDAIRGMNGQGKIKDNLVSYFDEIHGFILDSLNLGLSSYSSIADLYALEYENYDTTKNLQFTQEGLSSVVTKMENFKTLSSDYATQMSSHYNNISDLITASFPSIDAVTDSLTTMQYKINTFMSDCEGISLQYQGQIDSVKAQFNHIISFINDAQKISISTYKTGDIGRLPSFKGLYNNCSNLINFLTNNQEQINEAAAHIQAYVEMLQAQEEAKRLNNRFWSLLIEGVAIVAAGIVTVLSAGAALVAIGAMVSTVVFAASRLCNMANVVSDVIEQESTVRLRGMNDFSTAYNPIRDNHFDGDQERYNQYKAKVNAIDNCSKGAVNVFAIVNSLSGVTSMVRSFEKQIIPTFKSILPRSAKTLKKQWHQSKVTIKYTWNKNVKSKTFSYDGLYFLGDAVLPKTLEIIMDTNNDFKKAKNAEIYRLQGYNQDEIDRKILVQQSSYELFKSFLEVPDASVNISSIHNFSTGAIPKFELTTHSNPFVRSKLDKTRKYINQKIKDGSMDIINNYGKFLLR